MESMVWNLVEQRRLVSGGDWDDVGSTVKALTFGVLFEIAQGRVKHYKSDLFHDAVWLESYLTGPMQFEWAVRESGTFIGESVKHVGPSNFDDSDKYRFGIIERDQTWSLVIWHGERKPTDPDPQIVLPGESLAVTETQSQTISDPVLRSLLRRKQRSEETEVEETEAEDPLMEILSEPETVDEEVVNLILNRVFPTNGDEIEESETPTRRERNFNMEEFIQEQREKLEEAESARSELESKKSEIEEAEAEIQEFIEAMETFIDNLESVPSVSIAVDLDVSFDS